MSCPEQVCPTRESQMMSRPRADRVPESQRNAVFSAVVTLDKATAYVLFDGANLDLPYALCKFTLFGCILWREQTLLHDVLVVVGLIRARVVLIVCVAVHGVFALLLGLW